MVALVRWACNGSLLVGALALGCEFGSSGASGSGGMPGDQSGTASGTGDDGAPTSTSVGDGNDDDGPGDGTPTSGDHGSATHGDDTAGADTSDTTGTPPLEPAPWWDSAWSRRAELVVTETADGPLPSGYTMQMGKLDTQAWIEAGQLRNDYEDLRIVRWDGSESTELTRRIQRAGASAVQVWWKTQDEIARGTKNEYWLYWGNPVAGDAPGAWADSMAGTSEVYLAGEDFEEHLTGECPDGWEACAPQWSAQSLGNGQVLRGQSPPLDLLLAELDPPADVRMHARVRNVSPGACPGLVTHATGSTHVWAGYGCESGGTPMPGVSMRLFDGDTVTTLAGGDAEQNTEWHSIEVGWRDGTVSLWQDGALVGTAPAPAAASGGVGFSVENNIPGDFDDLYVRLWVDPEPSIELGAEETAP